MSRGEWHRCDAQPTVDRAPSVHVRVLSRGASRFAPITANLIEDGRVELYNRRDRCVLCEVGVTSTACNYGGSRPWWLCPECERRCELLYLWRGQIQCRQCAGLVYTTAQSGRLVRVTRKAVKCGDRIGYRYGDRIVTKPKGMHWRTFQRLLVKYRIEAKTANEVWQPTLARAVTLLQEAEATSPKRPPV